MTNSNPKSTVELQFINAARPGSNPDNIAIAKTAGENSNVYFIKVTAGEEVNIPTPVGYEVSSTSVPAPWSPSLPTSTKTIPGMTPC